MRQERALLAAAVVAFTVFVPAVAAADNCSGPGDCERTAGYNAAVSVASGLVALAMGLLGSSLAGTGVIPTLPQPPSPPRHKPRHGDVDADGQVYDAFLHGWVDRGTFEAGNRTRADNEEFRERNIVRDD